MLSPLLNILKLPRRTKRGIYLLLDTALVPLCLLAAHALRYGMLVPTKALEGDLALFAMMVLLGAAVSYAFRLPWLKVTALEARAVFRVAGAAGALAIAAIVLSYLLGLAGPRSVPLIFGFLYFVCALGARFAIVALVQVLESRGSNKQPVAIYGAGAAGLQLASALKASAEVKPLFFVDDNPNLHGLMMGGLAVYSPLRLQELAARHGIKTVLLAMPSVDKERLQHISKWLGNFDLAVQVMPSYVDILSGKSGDDTKLRTVSPDELLGRDKVNLETAEIAKAYAGRVVMVTGAGGSIGSELCRQLIECKPARIVLFEQGEFALYEIDRDLRPRAMAAGITVSSRLGSVTNRPRVSAVMKEEKVEIVLHAAAYKHVPLVEDNELEGARNNVIGTQIVAEVAQTLGVERFILVSTDKAVRPTNIMGATKRMAELVVQDLANRMKHTKFAMVRFGNVLGSSGSVLPLFQKQIDAGGPVTVTHPEVTRFFMTIPEAARLVLLAGAFARGGDVFVLDMGQPRRIIDIAAQMIALAGRKVYDPQTGKGDIAIEITGLRPGEKLYEELLIDDESLRATPHPKILRAEETYLSQIEVASMLRELNASIETTDTGRLRALVTARVDGYHHQAEAPLQAEQN
ncbi:MAG: polysaccharide biosynthesis protein [Rhodobacteraceae bacterium]|nr:polysaccharide biosynthesis protein [Paracoccaceae bacterium]